MKFLELAQLRQSVRAYKNTPVEREKIERCLEAARLAPSACNAQPWKFIVVDEPALKDAVAKETFSTVVSFNKFTIQAPVMIVIVTEPPNLTSRLDGMIKDKPFNLMDVGMAVEHLCLQAVEEGLGTCILGWFDEKAVKKLLNIPKNKRVDLIVCMGYPESDNVRVKSRKELAQMVSYNKYD
jgi:nitroreductase